MAGPYIEKDSYGVALSKGIVTKKPVTLSGTAATLAVGGTATVTGAATLSSTLAVTGVATFTAAPVFNGGRTASVNASSSATVTLTAAQSGGTFLLDRAGGTSYTLPSPAVGLNYRFLVSVLQTGGANVVVTAGASVYLVGAVLGFSGEKVTPSSTLGPYQFAANGSSHIQFTTNGTTTGGGIGTWLEVVCISTTLWYVYGENNSPSGNQATPFST